MRRRTFLTVSGEGIKPSDAMACDICLYNKTTQKLLIVESAKFTVSEYPSDKYSPVGVVVIPGNHNVYGNGSCAVMSLKYMSCDNPDSGDTSYQEIYWGQYGTDISNMTNYDKICYFGLNSTVNQTVQGVVDQAFLPSDKFSEFSEVQNPYDKDTYYFTRGHYSPSPYNEDDTRNTAYYQTSSPSTTSNCLSDFDGVGNTKILTDLATSQSDWKTASTITNNYNSGYSPAACCCWRYHTEGTKQGDWYLPAMGELGYMVVKINKINQTINTLITAYGSTVGVQIILGYPYRYWSSSESSNYGSIFINHNCNVDTISKGGSGLFVRSFLLVK